MTERKVKRIRRPLSDADRQRYDELREQLEQEKPRILREARRVKAEVDAATALHHACQLLKCERQAQGLSLADIRRRTGIERGALSRLENGDNGNPTVNTLVRIADALGKRIVIRLEDK